MAQIHFANWNQSGYCDLGTNHVAEHMGGRHTFECDEEFGMCVCPVVSDDDSRCKCIWDLERIVFIPDGDGKNCTIYFDEQKIVMQETENKGDIVRAVGGNLWMLTIPDDLTKYQMQYFMNYDADITLLGKKWLDIIRTYLTIKIDEKSLILSKDTKSASKTSDFESKRQEIEKIRGSVENDLRILFVNMTKSQQKMSNDDLNGLSKTLSYAFIICYVKPLFVAEQKTNPHVAKKGKSK